MRRTVNLLWLAIAAAMIVCTCARPCEAYFAFADVFSDSNYKWGDPVLGTGAAITWSFMADGTQVDPNFRMDPFGFPDSTGLIGTSNIGQLRNTVDTAYGASAFDTAIQKAVDTWASVANLTFTKVVDPGVPFAGPGSTYPDIRIGAFAPEPGHSFEYGYAAGFAAYPGNALAGDVIFNLNQPLQIAPGTEDTTLIDYFYGNDLEGLILHELGHALGLGHPDPEDPETEVLSVMYVGPGCCLYINRQPAADDIAGLQHLYGAALASDGDYDDDGDKDAADIDILWHIVRQTGTDPNNNDTADLNGDTFVNEDDVDRMLASKLTAGGNRAYGDANLSGGTPELTDYNLWRTGTGGWAAGDFDGSGGVPELNDYNLWRTGPTQFPTTVGSHGGGGGGLVPEPSSFLLVAIACAFGVVWRLNRRESDLRGPM